MLRDLIATIEVLRDRIRGHRQYLDVAAPEARTRVTLIDPLLRALEWDVGDPSLVEIEPVVGPGRADYALLRGVGEPVLLLEAKKLSDGKAHHGQLASYIVGENMRRSIKIPYCAITNGSRWQVFDVFTQDTVLDVSVEDGDPRRCALRLLGLWRPALQATSGLEPTVELGQGSVRRQHNPEGRERSRADATVRTATPATRQTGSEREDARWTHLDSETLSPSKEVLPSEIRFPDGSIKKAGRWTDVLAATVKWLFDTGSLRKDEMPFTVGGSRRYCVSLDGHRPDGRKLERARDVWETGIQIEVNLEAEKLVRFAADLLKRYDKSPSQVALRLTSR